MGTDENTARSLPPGISEVLRFRAHDAPIEALAWSSEGNMLGSYARDHSVRVWENDRDAPRLRSSATVTIGTGLAFDDAGRYLVCIDAEHRRHLVNTKSGAVSQRPEPCVLAANGKNSLEVIVEPNGQVYLKQPRGRRPRPLHVELKAGAAFTSLALHSDLNRLALGQSTGRIEIWSLEPACNSPILSVDHPTRVYALDFDRSGRRLVSGDATGTIRIWDIDGGRLLRTVEGHTYGIRQLAFFGNGALIASRDSRGAVRISETATGATVLVNEMHSDATEAFTSAIAVDPGGACVAVSTHGGHKDGSWVEVWSVDCDVFANYARASTIAYASAKMVLVGEQGVGKTGLGWRLAHGTFREHSSTHGQQFWVLDQLAHTRTDGTICEAVLWDLAGQPDYRLVHALFLDAVSVALLVFDPADADDPLATIDYWVKQLRHSRDLSRPAPPEGRRPQMLLIAARVDRGHPRIPRDAIEAFCAQRGIREYVVTSALDGTGIDELVKHAYSAIDWDSKPATASTLAFKELKDRVLRLKQSSSRRTILDLAELRAALNQDWHRPAASENQVANAVDHLAVHGYVSRLTTSTGVSRILIDPALLNNIAASMVLEARRNPRGLGSLEETLLRNGGYKLPELDDISKADGDILLDAAIAKFLEHNICFRETDPLSRRSYLVFPELINLESPRGFEEPQLQHGPSYLINGPIENVYSSLVVLLGYTNTFSRTKAWRRRAEYVVGEQDVCGLVLDVERDGELDITLYFGDTTSEQTQALFESLFENFLAGRDLTVSRFRPVLCDNGHEVKRTDIKERLDAGRDEIYCIECGGRIMLDRSGARLHLARTDADELKEEREVAAMRSGFEQKLYRLKTHFSAQKVEIPVCFVSYAWGVARHETWVEQRLVADLANAGVTVLFDRRENSRIGSSIPRFIERIGEAHRVLVVGTQEYLTKYENRTAHGFVSAAEGDLIAQRMVGTEVQKCTVLPILLDGAPDESFPPLLRGRVYADFRDSSHYFDTFLEVLVSIYDNPRGGQDEWGLPLHLRDPDLSMLPHQDEHVLRDMGIQKSRVGRYSREGVER
jgi:GTPase SAR1 family protein